MPSKKGSNRLIDMITRPEENEILNKFLRLHRIMESVKGNYNIDDFEMRWVQSRLDMLGDKKKLTKDDFLQANLYWKKYTK
tara:strand:+ start:918 stop:1160 length:243 start_codon:yes stop_codon:yes gene_type:complete